MQNQSATSNYLKLGASFRWSFRSNPACVNKEMMTIGLTHPTLQIHSFQGFNVWYGPYGMGDSMISRLHRPTPTEQGPRGFNVELFLVTQSRVKSLVIPEAANLDRKY